MPIVINPNQLPQIIKDKYKLVSNSLRNPVLVDVKNRVNVEYGDIRVNNDWLPHLKIGRWGDGEDSNEVDFSLKIIETQQGQPKLSFDGEKIVWEKGDIKIEFYDAPDEKAQKMVWYLKAKPSSNKVEFDLDFKDLKFHLQKPLTEELNSSEWDVLTETFAERGSGETYESRTRPENVVGSYAVYHSYKGKINDINGKDYKVGKAFHIYRPKIIDNEGNWVWGKLVIDTVNKKYSVEIDQDFLDNAVYPIRSNDTFGHNPGSHGATQAAGTTDLMYGSFYDCSDDGTVTKIAWYNWSGNRAQGPQRLILYKTSDGSLIDVTNDVDNQPEDQYNEIDATLSGSVTSTNYIIVHWGEEYSLAYDAVTDAGCNEDVGYPGTTPNPWTTYSVVSVELSLYVVYTPSGGTTHEVSITESATATDSQNAAGSEYNVTITESASASDSQNAAGSEYNSTITESATATDSSNAVKVLSDSITESATATDTQTCQTSYAVDITESATAQDSSDAIKVHQADITESATATDTPDATGEYNVTITESATAQDSQNGIRDTLADITESASASDSTSCQTTYSSEITESATATDSQDAVKVHQADITESATATDTTDAIGEYNVVITELANAQDSQDGIKFLIADIVESATAIDIQDGSVGGEIYEVSIVESCSATDTQDGTLGNIYAVSIIERASARDLITSIKVTTPPKFEVVLVRYSGRYFYILKKSRWQ